MTFVRTLILLVSDKKLIRANLFSGKNYSIFRENFVWAEISVRVLCKRDSLARYGGDPATILKLLPETMFIAHTVGARSFLLLDSFCAFYKFHYFLITCSCVNLLARIFPTLPTLGCHLASCNICIGSRLAEEFCTIVGPNTLERLLASILHSMQCDTLKMRIWSNFRKSDTKRYMNR